MIPTPDRRMSHSRRICPMPRRLLVCLCALAAFGVAPAAHAAVKPFGLLTCTVPDGPNTARYCGLDPGPTGSPRQSITAVPTVDHVPLDPNVALPPEPQGDGLFPLIVISHGWGGQKNKFKDTGSEAKYVGTLKELANKGYAVLSFTARGFNGSCGNDINRLLVRPDCQYGHIRLDDYRFEAMDVEYLAGRLVDQGIAKPNIGVAGESYGGGVSLNLAVLKGRMCSDLYRSDRANPGCTALIPWTTRAGTPMSIAAAAPIIPWSDLIYSLLPNGRTLDYTITNPFVYPNQAGDDASPVGVEKQSFVSGLFATGKESGYYQAPLVDQTDTSADLTTWNTRVTAGEPYDDSVAQQAITLIARFRSPYNMPPAAGGPAPLFISNGWTDDLFPPEEALRFYNRERAEFPGNPIALLFPNHAHQRGADAPADLAIVRSRVQAEFDHFVKGDGTSAPSGVEAYLTSCPAPSGASPGPFSAGDWAGLHPGEVRFLAAPAASVPPQGDPRENQVSDPVAAGNDPCGSVPGASDAPGSATYRLPEVAGTGYTLLGSPTVIGKFAVQGGGAAQIVGRLWDVAPDGSEILVAKGVYRPAGSGVEVFQLHANGWHFAAGHTPRLELLGSDSPYLRASNGGSSITASELQLRLPTAEGPDCVQVLSPAAPVLPDPATRISRALAPRVSAVDSGPCGSAKKASTGTKAGTVGGKALKKGTPPAAKAKSLKARIRFGKRRHRTLAFVRRSGLGVVLHCSQACRTTAHMRIASKRIRRLRRSSKGDFAIHVRPTKAGMKRLERHLTTKGRLIVTVTDAAGKHATRRTGHFVVRLRPLRHHRG